MTEGRNVLGGELEPCGFDPLTGFYRDGTCRTGGQDLGVHAVCAVMTEEFLEFSASVGNDLSTPHPEWGFAGLQPGRPDTVAARSVNVITMPVTSWPSTTTGDLRRSRSSIVADFKNQPGGGEKLLETFGV